MIPTRCIWTRWVWFRVKFQQSLTCCETNSREDDEKPGCESVNTEHAEDNSSEQGLGDNVELNDFEKYGPIEQIVDTIYEPVHVSHDHPLFKLLNQGLQILLNLCGSCRAIISMSIATSRLKNIEFSMFYDDFSESPVDHDYPKSHFCSFRFSRTVCRGRLKFWEDIDELGI